MYEHTPSRNLSYSPLPARYFVRNDGLLNTQPAGVMLRARDQAWWNLLWLLFPQLDDALRVTCRQSAEWFHSRRRNEDWKFFRTVRRLLWDRELAPPSGLKEPLNLTPATEFVRAHGKAVAGRAETLCQTPRALLRTMTQRAEVSDHGKVALLCPQSGAVLATAPREDYQTLIAPSVEARCAWLTRAAAQLVPLFERAGLQVPPVKLELDRILTRRRGACYMAMDGVNRIVISPCYVDCLDVLDTLAHELLHAVDNNASGHREAFQRNASKIGFIPRGAGSLQRGPALEGALKEIHAGLGPYPQFAAKFVV